MGRSACRWALTLDEPTRYRLGSAVTLEFVTVAGLWLWGMLARRVAEGIRSLHPAFPVDRLQRTRDAWRDQGVVQRAPSSLGQRVSGYPSRGDRRGLQGRRTGVLCRLELSPRSRGVGPALPRANRVSAEADASPAGSDRAARATDAAVGRGSYRAGLGRGSVLAFAARFNRSHALVHDASWYLTRGERHLSSRTPPRERVGS